MSAAVFEEVEDVVEAVDSVVIWIGDIVCIGIVNAEIAHPGNLFFCLDGWCSIMQIGNVVVIHADYEVEIVEIRRTDHSAAVVEMETVLKRSVAHTPVGKVAGMASVESRRIKFRPYRLSHNTGA